MSDSDRTEQEVIAEVFGNKCDGFFIDIGAFDGICYSNTYALHAKGWSGILIEPDPDTFKRLVAAYPDATRVTLINAAIAKTNGPIKFYQHLDPQHIGWHSIDPKWVSTWGPGTVREIVVKGIRFDSLVLPRAPDFISIDTEGFDADVLESIPDDCRPSLFMIEVDKDGIRPRVEREMKRRGYRLIWGTYLNSAYCRQ